MKRNLLLFLLLASITGYTQSTINNYKYVLVPEKFDFQKETNQYRLNTVTKFLLEQKGFTVYYDNLETPKEIAGDRCSALKAEVTQRKAIFATNLTITLKDCQGNVVFKSKEGKSREKDWGTAYEEALKDAFSSLNDVPYTYNGTVTPKAQQTTEAPATTAPASQPATTTPASSTTTPSSTPATPEVKEPAGTLYAQATANGFQLIDTTPKIVFTLLKTSAPDYFIASKGATQGIVFKKNGEWVFEYYNDNKLIGEKLLIKF